MSFEPNKQRTMESVRRCAKLVYLACEEDVAKDISAELTWAADEIERLREFEWKYRELCK